LIFGAADRVNFRPFGGPSDLPPIFLAIAQSWTEIFAISTTYPVIQPSLKSHKTATWMA
jgi:hypothetical protein